MFRDIIDSPARTGSRRTLTVPLSIAAHVVLAAIVLIGPLLAPDILPEPRAALLAYVARDVVLPEAPPPPRRRTAPVEPARPAATAAVPLEAPDTITPETPSALPVDDLIGAVDGTANLPESIAGEVTAPAALPPPPPPPAAPVRVGGSIAPPVKVRDARPGYPAVARAARVQGTVVIETTIDATGRVIDARVTRSIPLLDEAALEAVRQWEFTPTLLNGQPVAVVMTVTVRFQLE